MFATNHNILFKAMILALCVISFVHIFLFPIYDINGGRGPAKTYMDFEQSLCTTNIRHKKIVWRSPNCPQYGIVTAMQGGRLGNQMWEYAAVWALARRTGLEPYVPRCIRLKLDQVFEALTVPTFEEISHCPVDVDRFVNSLDVWNFTNQSIVLPRYSVQPELVVTWVDDIVHEFAIRKRLREKSQQILRFASIGHNRSAPPVFVGVHVRRTDYIGYLQRKHGVGPATMAFYKSAMRHFEAKYANVVFVIVSDDPVWCARKFSNIKNVYVTSKVHRNSPALDLAILASCNHSIFDFGTFGEWGALLSCGETIFYNLSRHSSEKLGQLLPNWYTI